MWTVPISFPIITSEHIAKGLSSNSHETEYHSSSFQSFLRSIAFDGLPHVPLWKKHYRGDGARPDGDFFGQTGRSNRSN